MQRLRYYMDWLFKDLSGRRGKYVLTEAPNAALIVFMIFIVIGVVSYTGWFHTACFVIAYAALIWWSIGELRSGRSRFRRLLGYGGIVAVIGALLLHLGV